ncbi:BTAD domain-containing putative transcriptional regulator [Microtetraspora sp. NBRC 16547]|uniref:BTAD domain-containing putative transcriptional regulator n=1 Tax=Microtetraspora sp. NBRC 16547 TaxID=3030993 RepID=UPI00255501E7|nr:BTAD domain-containing putative transcriptional regulator [Microtetraspora sp. NBRC 16547]
MRFGILGGTRAWRGDGSEVPVGGPAQRALLALLLAHPGDVVPADRLIDDLYGSEAPAGAAHALQSQMSRLRRALRPDYAIERTPAGYRLDVDPGDVDAHRFAELSAEGRQALRDGDLARASALLSESLTLWRGQALADAADAGSARAHAVRLEELRLDAVEVRIEVDLQQGAHRAVIPELRELTRRHPLRERLHGLLIRALHAEGRQAEALTAYEEVRRLLAEELGVDPSAELAATQLAILRGERPAAAASLPAQLTSFVGRSEDVEVVTRLLGTARLVTLLGPGGVGKTRLSIEAAGRLPDQLDVRFVELAPLRDGAALPHAVLRALGLRESALLAPPSGTEPLPRLVAALADRRLLLVLDNCEHIVEAAAALAGHLLAVYPGLRIMATSREPLGITGENLWPVRSLAPSSAARLFADRAAAVRPGFVPDGAGGEAVRRICEALDGLPLAIELAAARMRTHELDELLDRLHDRFRLLSRGSRTAEARHQTLRAVVAWSWDLLSPDERMLARRLTVFSGGATPRAAEQVCDIPDAEDVLDSLADKSLLDVGYVTGFGAGSHTGSRTGPGTGTRRYRMLDIIRAYCAEQLDAAGETDALRRAHAHHFLALAREADPHLRRSGQLEWLDRLAAEHENLNAALHWAVQAGEVELGLDLIASLSSYFWIRGVHAVAAAPAAALLDAIGTSLPPGREGAYVLCVLTAIGRLDRETWLLHRQAAESLLAAGRGRHPAVTLLWPLVNALEGDPAVTFSLLTAAGSGSDPWERAITDLILGYPQLASGDLAAAERTFTATVDAFRVVGDRWGTALALDALAGIASMRGDPSRALALTDEALRLTRRIGALEDIADLLCNRGDYRLGSADPSAARADFEEAADAARQAGSPAGLAAALRGLGDVARLEGDLPRARDLYERALERFDTHWVRSLGHRTRALVGLGRIAEASGDLADARAHYLDAVAMAASMGAPSECTWGVEALAGVALVEGDAATATLLLGAAASLHGVTLQGDPELTVQGGPEVMRVIDAAREALGRSPYEEFHARGRGLRRDEVLRLIGMPEAVVQASTVRWSLVPPGEHPAAGAH